MFLGRMAVEFCRVVVVSVIRRISGFLCRRGFIRSYSFSIIRVGIGIAGILCVCIFLWVDGGYR